MTNARRKDIEKLIWCVIIAVAGLQMLLLVVGWLIYLWDYFGGSNAGQWL